MVACLLALISVTIICHIVAQKPREKIGAAILSMVSIVCSLVMYFALLSKSGGIDQGKWIDQLALPVGLHILLFFALMLYLLRVVKK